MKDSPAKPSSIPCILPAMSIPPPIKIPMDDGTFSDMVENVSENLKFNWSVASADPIEAIQELQHTVKKGDILRYYLSDEPEHYTAVVLNNGAVKDITRDMMFECYYDWANTLPFSGKIYINSRNEQDQKKYERSCVERDAEKQLIKDAKRVRAFMISQRKIALKQEHVMYTLQELISQTSSMHITKKTKIF
jgi:hypothetical protein